MKKSLLKIVLFLFFILSLCSYSFANTNMINDVRNTVMDAGNTVGNGLITGKNAVVNGTENLTNNTEKSMNGISGTVNNTTNDAYNTTRTATTDSMGISTNTWTWLIVGIVGIVIVALVWIYGSQYERNNYDK